MAGEKRVAFYTRISTDEDRQKYSLDGQRDRLEAFCIGVYGADKFSIVEVFRDTESGAHLNRPNLKRMLAAAEAGHFDELIVFRVDRLSRKLNDLGPMVERLLKWGVTFRSVSESFDTASPVNGLRFPRVSDLSVPAQCPSPVPPVSVRLRSRTSKKWGPGSSTPGPPCRHFANADI